MMEKEADVCLGLARVYQAQSDTLEAIVYYERYHSLILQCGTDEQKIEAKKNLMNIYEEMSDKVEIEKLQLLSTRGSSSVGGHRKGRRRGENVRSHLSTHESAADLMSTVKSSTTMQASPSMLSSSRVGSVVSSDKDDIGSVSSGSKSKDLMSLSESSARLPASSTLLGSAAVSMLEDPKLQDCFKRLSEYLEKFLNMAKELEGCVFFFFWFSVYVVM
jgi:hypothetical protein